MNELDQEIREWLVREADAIRLRHGGWTCCLHATEEKILEFADRIAAEPELGDGFCIQDI